jgi:hypothetical protein
MRIPTTTGFEFTGRFAAHDTSSTGRHIPPHLSLQTRLAAAIFNEDESHIPGHPLDIFRALVAQQDRNLGAGDQNAAHDVTLSILIARVSISSPTRARFRRRYALNCRRHSSLQYNFGRPAAGCSGKILLQPRLAQTRNFDTLESY